MNEHFESALERFRATYGDRPDIKRIESSSYDTTPNVPDSPHEPCLVAHVDEGFDLSSLPREFGGYWVICNFGEHSSHPLGEPVD